MYCVQCLGSESLLSRKQLLFLLTVRTLLLLILTIITILRRLIVIFYLCLLLHCHNGLQIQSRYLILKHFDPFGPLGQVCDHLSVGKEAIVIRWWNLIGCFVLFFDILFIVLLSLNKIGFFDGRNTQI